MKIKGTWYNQLGSSMELDHSGALLSGTYETHVGAASGKYALTGWIDAGSSSGSHAIGWTVLWNNAAYGDSHCLTSWVGQFIMNEQSGQEELHTAWLMTLETPEVAEWRSITTGHDVFRRQAPGAEYRILRKQAGFHMVPHPPKLDAD